MTWPGNPPAAAATHLRGQTCFCYQPAEPYKAADWSRKVDRQKNNIFSYIVFLRITPFLPNWFINIVSPVIGVRLPPFWIGTFVGVAPPSFIAIQAGTTLQQLTSGLDALTFQSVALLVVFAFLSILPVFLRNRSAQVWPLSIRATFQLAVASSRRGGKLVKLVVTYT